MINPEDDEDSFMFDGMDQDKKDVIGLDEGVRSHNAGFTSSDDSDLMLSLSDVDDDVTSSYVCPNQRDLSIKERVHVIRARRQMKQSDSYQQKSLEQCRAIQQEKYNVEERIKELEEECSRVFAQLQDAIKCSDGASKGRLMARYNCICQELSETRRKQQELLQKVSHASYTALKCEEIAEEMKKNEREIFCAEMRRDREDQHKAMHRLSAEKRVAQRSLRWAQRLEEENSVQMQEFTEQNQDLNRDTMTAAEISCPTAAEVLAVAAVTARGSAAVTAGCNDVQELQRSVAMSFEQIVHSNQRAEWKKMAELEEEERWREELTARGKNATREIMRHRYAQDMEKKYKEHMEKRRQGEINIVEKILNEEIEMKKRMKRLPELFPQVKPQKTKVVRPHSDQKISKILEKFQSEESLSVENISTESIDQNNLAEELKTNTEDDLKTDTDDLKADTPADDLKTEPQENDLEISKEAPRFTNELDYGVPEFEGLWDKKNSRRVGNVYTQDKSALSMPPYCAPDVAINQRIEGHVAMNLVKQQKAGGHLFRGDVPFRSKPELIIFKDFEVGRTYRKRVVLTNVTLTLTYCKLAGVSDCLKDCVEISFNPPGHLSAGMTCDLCVTFKPKMNIDLEGEVKFIGEAGTFCIPILCKSRKCEVSVDTKNVDFGVTIVGETIRRIVTLTNSGGLPAHYDFRKVVAEQNLSVQANDSPSLVEMPSNTLPHVENVAESGATNEHSDNRPEYMSPCSDEQSPSPSIDRVRRPEIGQGTPMLSQIDSVALPSSTEKHSTPSEQTPATPYAHIEENNSIAITTCMKSAQGFNPEDKPMEEIFIGPQAVSGILDPCSSVSLELLFLPIIAGTAHARFSITFLEPDLNEICIEAVGRSTDVPVYIERPCVDLKICSYDHLYQDSVVLHNSGQTAVRATFEVCKEMREHLEILPKTILIQPHSKSSAHIKFLPRKSLSKTGAQCIGTSSSLNMETLVSVNIDSLALPLTFNVYAIVTSTDIVFDKDLLEFGYCTVYDRACASVTVCNPSLLPQSIGFIGTPDCIEIKPNDGFITLLPSETVALEVMFTPHTAANYCFDLTCKTLNNRQFRIRCSGVGVCPPARLSHQLVRFPATSLYDSSSVTLHVINNHVRAADQSAARIGQGDEAVKGPVSFQFVVPEDLPITISPRVGSVPVGKSVPVSVRFSPVLNEMEIRKEGARLWNEAAQLKAAQDFQRELALEQEQRDQKQEQAASKANQKKQKEKKDNKEKDSSGDEKKSSDKEELGVERQPEPAPQINACDILVGSDEYLAGYLSLVRGYMDRMDSYKISCHLASGDCTTQERCALAGYSLHNTLYLELSCMSKRPDFIVVSDGCQGVIDFDSAALNQSIVKSLTIQNISTHCIHIRSSCLNAGGPFEIVNALRPILPGCLLTLKIRFTPPCIELYQEDLKLHSCDSTVTVTLKGIGICPLVNISVENGLLDLGAIIAGEFKQDSFKIHNKSCMKVEYSITLESHSFFHRSRHLISSVIHNNNNSNNPIYRQYVGTQNNSGQQVFECIPLKGSIEPGDTSEVSVTFLADHESEHFTDRCLIEFVGQTESHRFMIKGRAYSNNIYVTGGVELNCGVDSLSLPSTSLMSDNAGQHRSMLVTLKSERVEKSYTTVSHVISVCCIKSYSLNKKPGKTNGDYSFENINNITTQGFTIDQPKGAVEAGNEKQITVSWTPPAGLDADAIICLHQEDLRLLTLKTRPKPDMSMIF